jgi:two-component system, NarL family, response regulator LiaR
MNDNKIRVLLADDHAVVREGIRQFLERASDIDVIAEADDGEQAQALISEHHPDVVVLDIQMPKKTGIDVTRWVRVHARQTGVLILTAYNDDPYVIAVLQAGANGYVLKTASPVEIIQAVRDVHAGRSAINQAIAQKLISYIARQKDEMPVDNLSEREMEVLRLLAKGSTNKAIAVQLGISDRTVQGHIAHIFAKMHVTNRTEAVMRAISLGWIQNSEIDNV